MLFQIILASLAVMAASLVGVIALWKQVGPLIERNLNFLVSFAAGIFLVLFITLAEEVLHGTDSLLSSAVWIGGGALIAWLLVKLFPETHHHHEDCHDDHLDARKLLIGDTIHNVGDGVLLAISFMASSALGFVTAISIFFHELVQEISEFFVLRKAGYSTRGALQINLVTASAVLVGSVGGYFLLEEFSAIEIPILGIATGALLATLLQDLIPHSFKHAKRKGCLTKHIVMATLGALLMFGIFSATGAFDAHSHGPEETSHEHTEGDHHHE